MPWPKPLPNPFDLHVQFEALWMAQRQTETLPIAEEELRLAEAQIEGAHPQTVRALLDVAMAADAVGDREKADHHQERAHEMLHELQQKAQVDPENPATAAYWMFEADRLWPMFGQEEEAAALYRRALERFETLYGLHDERVAEVLARFGEAYYVNGQTGPAEPLYRRAIDLFNRTPDDQAGTWKRKSVEAFARLLVDLGRPAEAIPYFERALTFYPDDVFGRQTRYFLLIGYASCLRSLGQGIKADALETEARQLLPHTNPGEFGFRAG